MSELIWTTPETNPETTRAPQQTGVKFVRPELAALLPQYRTIRDCLEGEQAVKGRGRLYLPDPTSDPEECKTPEATCRYSAYLTRAVFYNATRRTLEGLVGQIFSKEPDITVPDELLPLTRSISGQGVSIQQQSKEACDLLLGYGRAGLLVDFPQTEGGATKAQLDSGEIRSTVTLYRPEDITNWTVTDIGAEEVVTLVVLKERHRVPLMVKDAKDQLRPDDFATVQEVWYRVLRLVNGGVQQDLWKPATRGQTEGAYREALTEYEPAGSVPMLGADAKPLPRIPFKFLGLPANRPEIQPPGFYDLASLNIAHYRNSADYEEACYVVGQPMLVVSGLDQNWYDTVLEKRIRFGSRRGLPLNTTGKADLLQAEPNTLVFEAMQAKERQMIALGAKLIEQSSVQRTATEAKIDSSAEGSILMSAAQNVSAAYVWALKLAAEFMGLKVPADGAEDSYVFALNDDFDIANMDAAGRAEVLKAWQAGGISWTEYRTVLKAGGIASQDNDDAKKEIDEKAKEDADNEVRTAGELAKATGDNVTKQPASA